MQLSRPAFALHPTLFGRGQVRDGIVDNQRGAMLSADVKLFATTFIAGFVFVSIMIG